MGLFVTAVDGRLAEHVQEHWANAFGAAAKLIINISLIPMLMVGESILLGRVVELPHGTGLCLNSGRGSVDAATLASAALYIACTNTFFKRAKSFLLGSDEGAKGGSDSWCDQVSDPAETAEAPTGPRHNPVAAIRAGPPVVNGDVQGTDRVPLFIASFDAVKEHLKVGQHFDRDDTAEWEGEGAVFSSSGLPNASALELNRNRQKIRNP